MKHEEYLRYKKTDGLLFREACCHSKAVHIRGKVLGRQISVC